ncbi:MAG: sortase [Patescibacteria group bacterium]
MAQEIFTKEEIAIGWKVLKIAIGILVVTGLLSSILRLTIVYMTEGKTGLTNFIEDKTDGNGALSTQANLKQSLEEEKKETIPVAPLPTEAPQYLEVPSLGIKTKIESPETTSVAVLDAALQRSAVYYQGSGTPGNRNMLIFGHSTGFSVVRNQAYKVFNTIKTAKAGEVIYVRTASGVHTYKVREVKRVSKYNTWIDFDSTKPMLTLATCDSFGKASDRWVLQADYVGFTAKGI